MAKRVRLDGARTDQTRSERRLTYATAGRPGTRHLRLAICLTAATISSMVGAQERLSLKCTSRRVRS